MKLGTHYRDIGIDPADLVSPASIAAKARRNGEAAQCAAGAAEALAGFGRGRHVFGLSRGRFSMVDVIGEVLDRTGPAAVSVWTWCVSAYELEAIGALLYQGKIDGFRMVIDWSGAARQAPWVRELQEAHGADCLRVTKTHAKIFTAATPCGWRVVARGSMNLNRNPRFEQFDVSDDPAIYDVVRGLEDELWTRGKPVPLAELEHKDAAALYRGDAEGVADDAPDWATGAGDGVDVGDDVGEDWF